MKDDLFPGNLKLTCKFTCVNFNGRATPVCFMIPPLQSLVQYSNPMLVAFTQGKKSKKLPKAMSQTEDILNSIIPPRYFKSGRFVSHTHLVGGSELTALRLWALCREWTEDRQLWVQYVSSTPATRLDVINLQEELDRKLQQRQARETGICPVREELYSQTFDELIRQVICVRASPSGPCALLPAAPR